MVGNIRQLHHQLNKNYKRYLCLRARVVFVLPAVALCGGMVLLENKVSGRIVIMKSNYILGYPVIDLHTHLRNDIDKHTKIAKECGIDAVVYMVYSVLPLDSVMAIKKSLKQKRNCLALPVSAITKNLEGEELVDIDKIKYFVAGFSDDGRYLANLDLLKQALEKDILIMAHCCPLYEISLENPELETEYIKNYINVLFKTKKGKLHIQHISKKSSVDIIRKAKNKGSKITCETCPHYFTYTKSELEAKVNPPLGLREDVLAIRQGLADGTIDIIASDYAPEPRITGIAGFRSFSPLCYGLVLDKTISKQQLKEKIYLNPKKIIGNNLKIWK